MMLKSVFANILEQFLKPRNFDYACAAKSFERIAREFPFAHIAANLAAQIIRRESRITHRSGLHATDNRAECVCFAHGARDDLLKIHLHGLKEVFRQVAAMKTD